MSATRVIALTLASLILIVIIVVLVGVATQYGISGTNVVGTSQPTTIRAIQTKALPPAITYHAPVLVLSCVEYRLRDEVIGKLEAGYTHSFDYITLPGSCLFVNHPEFSKGWCGEYTGACKHTFLSTVTLAVTFHKIKKIIVVEHEHCLGYKEAYGNLGKEITHQLENVREFRERMIKTHPELEIKAYLLKLDGELEPLPL